MSIEDFWKLWIKIPENKIRETLRFLVFDYNNFFGDVPFAIEWRYVDCSYEIEYRVRPA